jgi:hypothetical protein
MFQVLLVLTFEDSTPDSCLVDILSAYSETGSVARALHRELLLSTFGVLDADVRGRERLEKIMSGVSPEESQRARDIQALTRMERGQPDPSD